MSQNPDEAPESTEEAQWREGTGSPIQADRQDGGPGSHNEGETGGVDNDPASGGISQTTQEDDAAVDGG